MKPKVKQTGCFYIVNKDGTYTKLCDVNKELKIRTIKVSEPKGVMKYIRKRRFLKMFREPVEFEIKLRPKDYKR